MQEVTEVEFAQEKLIPVKQKIFIKDSDSLKSVSVDGYQLPNYEAFGLRLIEGLWALSIRGKLVTYGSYKHTIEVILLLVETFACCFHSETSLIHFLQSPDYLGVVEAIVSLRKFDHEVEI